MFEWDPRKAATNAAKHGVSFDEAVSVFLDATGWMVLILSIQSLKNGFADLAVRRRDESS